MHDQFNITIIQNPPPPRKSDLVDFIHLAIALANLLAVLAGKLAA